MDLGKQKKLEPFRYSPMVGGVVLMVLGPWLVQHDQQLILSTTASALFALGMMGVALGAAGIKLRRLLFSQEERIQKLEMKLLDEAGRSEKQEP